jgi:peptidoglycan-N-acetylglucosamine deacetylase
MRVVLALAAVSLCIAGAASARTLPDGGGSRTPGGIAVERLAQRGVSVYCGGGRGRLVALTFDDGPSPYTRRLVGVLRRHRARATFFDLGQRLGWWGGDLPQLQLRVGVVGNHTWSHRRLDSASRESIKTEIELTQHEAAARISRHVSLFRPPYGATTPLLGRMLRSRGLLQVLWSVDSGDSGVYTSPASVVRTVEAHVRPGSIVLLHDIHPWTPLVTERLLRVLQRRHLRAVTVPELLANDRPRLTRDARGLRTRCR